MSANSAIITATAALYVILLAAGYALPMATAHKVSWLIAVSVWVAQWALVLLGIKHLVWRY